MSTNSFTKHGFSLSIFSIFPAVYLPDGSACAPFSQDQAKKLVDDLGFPDRFFVDLIIGRRLSIRIATRTGDCWLMCDPLLPVVTLHRERNNDILSIIVSGNQHRYSNVEPVVKRYISSKTYHRHSLFPILLIADAALEDYRALLARRQGQQRENNRILNVAFIPGGPVLDRQDSLVHITRQREQLTRISGNLKTFNGCIRNLLNLHDRSDHSSGTNGPLQTPSGQSGGQTTPIPSLDSMLQYLVSASGEILEKVAVLDMRLQNTFLVVRTRDREFPLSRY